MIAVKTGRGRPLRFLGVVLGGWIGLRVVLLWPHLDSPGAVLRAIAPVSIAAAEAEPPTHAAASVSLLPVPDRVSPRWRIAVARQSHRAADPRRVALALLGLVRFGDPIPVDGLDPLLPGLPRTAPPPTSGRPPSRWSGSAWLVARGGAGIAPGGLGGQLGGSQAGVRLAYLLDRKRRVALAARATSPLGRGLREAAVGVEWQPTRLPVRIIAEQRFAIGGGSSGPAIGVVGGFGPVALPLDFRLEAYGQAGVIRRRDTEAYADGAARVAHALANLGKLRLDIGAGVWGGAQRGAARLDVGPSLGITAPLGNRSVRLRLDWRQRVAGRASPGSGPALTLGSDF